jgi:cytochrome c553
MPPACSGSMVSLRLAAFMLVLFSPACGAPVATPTPPSGELIAFGGGSPGARTACFTCHGFRGEGDGRTPRLAGLSAGYLAKQLEDYANETRRDATMTPIATAMSARERRAIAHYYARLPSEMTAQDHAATMALYRHGDAARGIRACANCHGARGQGRGAAKPTLAGQPAAYTAEQLRRWRLAVRRNDPLDVMGRVARPLTDEEIEALAAMIERM